MSQWNIASFSKEEQDKFAVDKVAVAFVLINVVADKLRLWSGIAWIIVAGIIITLMLKGKEPGDEFRALITVFAFLASAWYCVVQYRKEKGESQS
ncbi:TPA: hypothetical protein ACHV7G_004582 [Klebsiella variicola]